MQFKEIIGQEGMKQKLASLVSENRLPHALMLFGPPGTGKRKLAVATAQFLSCTARSGHDSCGICPSCIKFSKLVHPDLHFVYPVTSGLKSGNKLTTGDYIEQWRDAFLENPYLSENQWYEAIGAENKQGLINVEESKSVIEKINLKPYESEYRMMIIWLPERMNGPTANKLLKLIEEPPPQTHIIMVSEHTDRILPTILSRTQLMQVPPLEASAIREGLLQLRESDPDMLEDAVRKANGNFTLALSTISNDEQELRFFELFTSLMRLAYGRKIIDLNGWVDEVAGIGRERQKQLLDYGLRLLRENFMMHMSPEELTFMSRKEADFSRKFHPFIHGANVYGLAEEFSLAGNHISANGNPKIIFMDLAVKVIRLLMQKAPGAA